MLRAFQCNFYLHVLLLLFLVLMSGCPFSRSAFCSPKNERIIIIIIIFRGMFENNSLFITFPCKIRGNSNLIAGQSFLCNGVFPLSTRQKLMVIKIRFLKSRPKINGTSKLKLHGYFYIKPQKMSSDLTAETKFWTLYARKLRFSTPSNHTLISTSFREKNISLLLFTLKNTCFALPPPRRKNISSRSMRATWKDSVEK